MTGPGNRLLSDGTYDYEYDDEGNLILRTEISGPGAGNFREFEYDHRNRLVKVTDRDPGGPVTQVVEFAYDSLDRRIAKTVDADGDEPEVPGVTYFVYDREDVILDFEGPAGPGTTPAILTKRYLHGPGIDQVLAQEDGGGQVAWLLTDHLGTTRDLVDSSGDVVNHITYDSFGNVVAQTDSSLSSRYLFTGRELDDELGLYYYRARYYDQTIGRFLSEDPIGFESRDPNLFKYVANNPIQSIDPSGEIPHCNTFCYWSWHFFRS